MYEDYAYLLSHPSLLERKASASFIFDCHIVFTEQMWHDVPTSASAMCIIKS